MTKKVNQKTKSIVDSNKQISDNSSKLLDNINWLDPDRIGLQSSIEIMELLKEELERYFTGEVTQKYILQLVRQLDNDFYDIAESDYDPKVKGITCELSEINSPAIRNNVYKTPEEIDVIFRSALEQLRKISS